MKDEELKKMTRLTRSLNWGGGFRLGGSHGLFRFIEVDLIVERGVANVESSRLIRSHALFFSLLRTNSHL